ncbi:Crp/Fnr family transcriptional regulator [Flagellimonas allohymeniacidonis]|uniref:Crp/Fnr family transcriptional regulator n=1 Tax=Flagellimonas allohymeniacidonis TaxID=2517819 RepID=UPI00197BBFBE|nr:Crp/Fnr family transcriptional regulator [Allomuricauda hymeniacidonis]
MNFNKTLIPKEYQGLFDNIGRYVTLSDSEKERIAAIVTLAPIKKRQFIDQPGYISLYRNYVVKGAFRSFFLDKDGKEHTVQIAIEDWFVSDFYSYITRTPATLFVEALEDAILLRMKYEDIEPLCGEIHVLSEYYRITTEKAFAYSRNRALSNLSMTAEERYLQLTSMYPGIVNRVPQKVIASYLGMTPEFLSKIRRGISGNS